MDGSFYSSRIISHIRFQGEVTVSSITASSQKLNILVAYLMLCLLVFDLVMMYQDGNSLSKLENPYHVQDLTNKTQLMQLILARQSLESETYHLAKKVPHKSKVKKNKVQKEKSLSESKVDLNITHSDNITQTKKNKEKESLEVMFTEAAKKNELFYDYNPDIKYESVIDNATTLKYLHINPYIIKFAQDGIILNKAAYASPLVSQLRFYFVLKNAIFQILLQTLPYSPSFQIIFMVFLEIFYATVTTWKYMAIKHLKSITTLVHIVGQSSLTIIFLVLVFGMTFKGEKYGNLSTLEEIDRNQWSYGENICMLVVSVALVVEFSLFISSMLMLTKTIGIQILSVFMTLGEDSTKNKILKRILKPLKKKKIPLLRMNQGIFYKLQPESKSKIQISKSSMDSSSKKLHAKGLLHKNKKVRTKKTKQKGPKISIIVKTKKIKKKKNSSSNSKRLKQQ